MRRAVEWPEPGQLVIVRNRPAVVRDTASSGVGTPQGNLHVAELEYLDGSDNPTGEAVVWEIESGARVLSGLRLPGVGSATDSPAPPELFASLVDALRWSSAGQSSLVSTMDGPPSLVCPWHGAVQVEDYQLYPVIKALAMPRVSLLLADDVGLGKTIEAALVATELIARRRIRRIIVVCPAGLQMQWREELREKFSLDFTVLDRDEGFRIQQTLGTDANPWATTPRIIASMDYLRQPDVLERFLLAAEALERPHTASVAWDLIIVDEAHNLSPSSFADDSQRCRMLREIMPHSEHRLFLTATPHNGYTQAFSGLLELLDPVRFQQKATLSDEDHQQIHAVVVRRLKSELDAHGTVRRFPCRKVEAVPVTFTDPAERRVLDALAAYRERGSEVASGMSRRDAQLARFLFSVLTKRLLSSSYAFARTWWSHVAGYQLEQAEFGEADNAARRAQADVADDEERTLREEDAVRQGAAWLAPYRDDLSPAAREVGEALRALGWGVERLAEPFGDKPPVPDARWDVLWSWVEEKLRDGKGFRDDERLLLFTEYKDTLDYLLWRFEREGLVSPVVRPLFGGSPLGHREVIKAQFNDPSSALRILVGTDAASEGLNFQESCRYVFHQEIPWNPMRLEQRNGRVDRHGQARDVFVYHFTSEEDADLRFLAHVARKVDQVREDLGSVGEVIDAAVQEHFTKRRVGEAEVDRRIELAREQVDSRTDTSGSDAGSEDEYRKAVQAFRAAELRLGLSPDRMARVLRAALQSDGGDLLPDEHASTDAITVYKLRQAPSWERLIDETVRIPKGVQASSLPKVVFDPAYFEELVSERRIFRARPYAILVRLGHPLMRRALSVFKRRLWEQDKGRWTIVGSPFSTGTEAVGLLHTLATATNDLRETIQEEVVTWPFLVEGGHLSAVEPEYWAELSRLETFALPPEGVQQWRKRLAEFWPDHEDFLGQFLRDQRAALETDLLKRLGSGLGGALKSERAAYDRRLTEIRKSSERSPQAAERLRRDLLKAERVRVQLTFDADENREREARVEELERKIDAAEWERQHSHLMLLTQRLERERDRLLGQALPLRYSLARVDVQPIGVEYRVRWTEGGGR